VPSTLAAREGCDLLVASSGGHLKQLSRLQPRLASARDRLWVTPRSAQGESLLAGEDVLWLPYVAPHDPRGIARAAVDLTRQLKGKRVGRLITTGASPALSALPSAIRHRASVHYIESAARVSGPSATGRLMQRLPRVHCYAQYESWASGRWSYAGSVFDDFRVRTVDEGSLDSVVVTVGVNATYGFTRLIQALQACLPPTSKVLWQVGDKDQHLLPAGADVRTSMPASELLEAMRAADLVIAHAGCGSALTALEAGHRPLLVPRLAEHDEHIDDHQLQIAHELHTRGLAVNVAVEDLSPAFLEQVGRGRVEQELGPVLALRGRA
jgi:UDP-N-acetylglucosamine--N-acetylmuramyl-(pentapeptide) pyrophosphoryl-undecaprenol N-acetylglucosamine transferase